MAHNFVVDNSVPLSFSSDLFVDKFLRMVKQMMVVSSPIVISLVFPYNSSDVLVEGVSFGSAVLLNVGLD